MSPADLEDLRRQLEQRAREIMSRSHETLTEARENLSVRTESYDAGEAGFIEALKSAEADMSERDRGLLVLIREALVRYADGEYGTCVECGEEIGLDRLRAIPWAARCADDQEKLEEDRRDTSPPTL
jgi:DnaK suppressor protein